MTLWRRKKQTHIPHASRTNNQTNSSISVFTGTNIHIKIYNVSVPSSGTILDTAVDN